MSWQKILWVLVVSAAPVSELRGGIPLALGLGFSAEAAFFLALLGNLLPAPFLLFSLPKIVQKGEKLPGRLGRAWKAFLAWQIRRHQILGKWGVLGLAALVAVPLPGTGLWTGAILAALFGIPPGKAALALVVGAALAGAIVLGASLGVLRFLGL